ncbi:MAG: sigma-70 family RNA polymerase sigma factor [Cellulophaga sp.]
MFASTEQGSSRIEALREAINKLPPKCKEVFILSKFEKMKYKVIAEKMGISIKTVENHMSKAFKELRKGLKIPLSIVFIYILF